MRILVTGGAGFIGSHLVDDLVEKKREVMVIDDLSTGKKSNLQKSIKKISLINKSLADAAKEIKAADYIYHLAALPRIERSIDDPLGTHEANVEGTLIALELAKRLKVKRFIYTSSSSVYGIQKHLPLKENFSPNPQNPYAYQKLMGEHYCQLYNKLYNLPVIIFRLFNVYGPRMVSKGSYKLVFTKWLEQIKDKKPLSVYGKGDQTRDFTYISDTVNGLISGLALSPKKTFEIFNIGRGKQISVKNLASLFKKSVAFLPPREYEEKFKEADISKIKKMLAWEPVVSIEEGIKRLLNFYTNN